MNKLVKIAAVAAVGFAAEANAESALPRPVRYIASIASKKHYIDLGVQGRSGLEVETTVEYYDTLPSSGETFLAASQGSGDTRVCFGGYSSTSKLYMGYKKVLKSTFVPEPHRPYAVDVTLRAGLQQLKVDGEVIVEKTDADEFDARCNLCLFASNQNGTRSAYASIRCFGVRIWDYKVEGREGERVLIRDFVPYLDADGNPCLYEKLGNEYNGSAYYCPGSSDKKLVYEEYHEPAEPDHYVEYIESTGTQYVDTDIPTAIGNASSCDMAFTELPTKDGACFLGEYTSSSYRTYLCYYYNDTFVWGNGGSYFELSPAYPAEVGQRYVVDADMFKDARGLSINAQQLSPYSTTTYNFRIEPYPYYLFARNDAGTPSRFAKARCYGAKMWMSKDGKKAGEQIPLFDLHPCVDKNGRPGLYDSVRGYILYNAAAGDDFLAGPAIAEAGVVVRIDGPSAAPSTPEAGTYADLEEGKSYDYRSESRMYDEWNAYDCHGFSTATSDDGSTWSAESALVDARACTHVFDGAWWRLTWKWESVAVAVSNDVPAGASVAYSPAAETYGGHYYAIGTVVTLTASESDGEGGRFNCWTESREKSVPVLDRTITVVADERIVRAPHYSHAWTLASEEKGVKTVTDGVWTASVSNGVVTAYSSEIGGILDFTTIERDLGFKVTAFKDWTSTRTAPAGLIGVVAPDVVSVGDRAFSSAANLKRAVFSPNLTRVGRAAFNECTELEELLPDLQTYLDQAEIAGDEASAFFNCSKIPVGDLFLRRKRRIALPTSYLCGIRATSIDLLGCRGGVDFNVETTESKHGVFGYNTALTALTLPREMNFIPRCMCWGDTALELVRFTGRVPPPDQIGYFYGATDYKLVVGLPLALNPRIVEDLQLREPTSAEMKKATFPTEAYETGKFLGVWDKPTSGWGSLSSSFARMWVVDMKAPAQTGMKLLFK